MEQVMRQAWAFFFRDYHLTRRYFSWVVVFTFYAVVNSATVVLIGVAAGDRRLTLTLLVGVMLWGLLSVVFQEIANSITYERWEGTLEYTFMAPVSRLIHLAGVSLFATAYAVVRAAIIVAGLLLFVDLDLSRANWLGIAVVLAVSSAARRRPTSSRGCPSSSPASTTPSRFCRAGSNRSRSSHRRPTRSRRAASSSASARARSRPPALRSRPAPTS